MSDLLSMSLTKETVLRFFNLIVIFGPGKSQRYESSSCEYFWCKLSIELKYAQSYLIDK